MTNRQIGRLLVPAQLIIDMPAFVADIFAALHFVALAVQWMPGFNRVEYVGISDRFEIAEENRPAPLYDLSFKTADDGTLLSVTVTPRKPQTPNPKPETASPSSTDY